MNPTFEIKSISGRVLYSSTTALNVKDCLVEAIAASANLSSANLRYADLSSANLSYADLSSADLRYADLRYADLSSANLSYADLSYADLRSANLHNEKQSLAPVGVVNLLWPVLISRGYMRIGCQIHTHAKWKGFTDEQIKSMSPDALEFWKDNKTLLLKLCSNHKKASDKIKLEEPK